MKSKSSLKDQLMTKYGGGFELHSWTNLPQGSGKNKIVCHSKFEPPHEKTGLRGFRPGITQTCGSIEVG